LVLRTQHTNALPAPGLYCGAQKNDSGPEVGFEEIMNRSSTSPFLDSFLLMERVSQQVSQPLTVVTNFTTLLRNNRFSAQPPGW